MSKMKQNVSGKKPVKPKRDENGRLLPGYTANPKGRPKGAKDKLGRDMKEAIEEAFERAGGVNYLVKLSESHPTVFAALLGKILPRQVDVDVSFSGAELQDVISARRELLAKTKGELIEDAEYHEVSEAMK